ncbi:MAG TPA: hypothetical protein VF541_09440 [Longimicrobium sp.]
MKTPLLAMLAVGLGLAARAQLPAQGGRPAPQVAALNAVIDYRLNWMGDSTRFDACSVYRAAGSREAVDAGLRAAFRGSIATRPAPCGAPESTDPRREVRVLVDSMNLSGAEGRVYLTVRRGEQTHEEEYQLAHPPEWAVHRVVLSNAVRVYYARPGGPGRPGRP